jgi:cytochrome c
MKKISILSLICVLTIVVHSSCGSGGGSGSSGGDLSDNPDYKAGLALTVKYNCATCHRPLEAFTGPAYADIAAKYKDDAAKNIPILGEKIIKGGAGNWGQAPMIPHPDVSKEDAETMVKYIFLIKK